MDKYIDKFSPEELDALRRCGAVSLTVGGPPSPQKS